MNKQTHVECKGMPRKRSKAWRIHMDSVRCNGSQVMSASTPTGDGVADEASYLADAWLEDPALSLRMATLVNAVLGNQVELPLDTPLRP